LSIKPTSSAPLIEHLLLPKAIPGVPWFLDTMPKIRDRKGTRKIRKIVKSDLLATQNYTLTGKVGEASRAWGFIQ
jgi:hypothetical protein